MAGSFAEQVDQSDNANKAQEGAPAGDQTPPATATTTQQGPFLAVGERTFASQDDVVTHISHAQNHITTLESENQQLKQQLAAAQAAAATGQTVEQLLAQIKNLPKEDQPDTSSQTGTIDPQDLVKSVTQEVLTSIDQRSTQQKQADNWQSANEALQNEFGDKAVAKVVERAKELGVSVSYMDDMAKASPKAFIELVAGKKIPVPAPSKPSTVFVNPDRQEQKPATDFMKMTTKDKAAEIQRRMAAATKSN